MNLSKMIIVCCAFGSCRWRLRPYLHRQSLLRVCTHPYATHTYSSPNHHVSQARSSAHTEQLVRISITPSLHRSPRIVHFSSFQEHEHSQMPPLCGMCSKQHRV